MLDVESEVSMFDALVKQTSGFREEQVAHYGIGHLDILSSACLVPGGGFEYSINGKSQSFETTDHLNAFLVHGTSGNVEPWVKGGVLGSFVQTFGDDAGGDMVAKHGHMVGIIPQLIIKNCRRDLRSSHGITIRESTGITTTTADDPNMQYCFWRPMLLAKFSVAGPAKDALMGTGALYLIDNDSSSTEWSGKISYPGKLLPPNHFILYFIWHTYIGAKGQCFTPLKLCANILSHFCKQETTMTSVHANHL